MAKARFASLTAGLLARKGEAHPAANSFAVIAGFGAEHRPDEAEPPSGLVREPAGPTRTAEPTLQDELDWMTTIGPLPAALRGEAANPTKGGEAARATKSGDAAKTAMRGDVAPRLTAVPPMSPAMSHPPLRGAAALLRRIGKAPGPVPVASPADPAPARRVHVTVRLDEARYVRLKLGGLRYHRTSQDILTRALDAYLTALGIDPVTEADLRAVVAAWARKSEE